MTVSLKNIIALPGILIHALNAILQQRKFIEKQIYPILNPYKNSSISSSDLEKIKKYYGYSVPAIMGEGFCMLRGKALNSKERASLSYLASLTGLYDDFFDLLKLPKEQILELTIKPEEATAKSDSEKLFLDFYQSALKYCPSKPALIEKFKGIYEAQVISLEQQEASIDPKRLEEITYTKGGLSLLFYRSVMENPCSPAEEKLLYHLGAMVQLANDIFDVYKDHQDEILTLVTQSEKIQPIRLLYQNLHREFIELLAKTEFEQRNKRQFARYLNLILCRAYVCLDFLEKAEKSSQGNFNLEKYSRKQLVCDMEKPENLIMTFRYYFKSPMYND